MLCFRENMAFKLFKNGDDLYDEGRELLKRGEYDKARNVLQKSIDKDGGVDDVAAVKVALIDLRGRTSSPGAYENVLDKLSKTSAPEFEFGLTMVDSERLRTECGLTVRKLNLLGSSSSDEMRRAQDIQALAQDFQAQMGDTNFIVKEIFENDTTVTGTTEFFNLMAVSYEIMSEATVWDNPPQAAEYEQLAMGYRQQNGQSGDSNLARINAYSSTCKCWLCGRIATGEGIHFYSTPADVSPSLVDDNSRTRSTPGSTHIYVCRACYSAVSNRSDEISRGYYNSAIDEMRNMESRIQAEIASLESQIAMIRMSR